MQFWTAAMEKQVCDRVQTLLTDSDFLKVFEKFGGDVFRRSSVFHGLGKFLQEQNVRGGTCFEIGTWNGLTALVLSRHFDQVVTVDIAHNAQKHAILKHLGVTNVHCVDILDNDHKAEVAKNTKFDFAYLDGDHAHDTDADFQLVRRCGKVLFHEVWPFQGPVWDLVNRLPLEQLAFGGAGLALWDASKAPPAPPVVTLAPLP